MDADIFEFINNPNTVDFIVRNTEFYRKYIESRPEIKLTQEIGGRYIIGYAPSYFVSTLVRELGSGLVSVNPLVLGLLDRANLDAAGIIQVQQQPFLDLKGRGVLIGIVDTGIDFTNKAFRYEDGSTKIQYLYDQTINSTPPPGFFFGTEYTKEQIDIALNSSDPFEIVPSRDTVGHGTFLASVACGREDRENPQFIGAAPDSELIVVKLRPARNFWRDQFLIPPEQENAFESTSIMIGIEYILTKARQLNKPVSIILALGTNSGGHDGFTLFEEYLTAISIQSGVCLSMAAGNESEARHHTQGVVSETGASSNIEIRVGENAGNVLVNIWNTSSDRLEVAIRSPTGELVSRVPAKSGTVHETRLILERSSVIVEYYFPVELSGGQATIVKIINATPGIWTVIVYGSIVLDGTYHAWLPITGFVSPNVEFLAPTPYYTIVVPATALGGLAVGAYDSETNSLFSQTSWGPTRLPVISPDFVAPGVDVGGVYPTGYGTMSGTSVAAAITAGAGALMLQWGIVEGNDPSLSTYQIKAFIIRGCSRDANVIYPNTQWGYGRLNLIQSFNAMREA